MLKSNFSSFDVHDLPLWKAGQSGDKGGIPAGQLQRSPFVSFDGNAQPMVLQADALDAVPIVPDTRFQRVSISPRESGDSMLKNSVALMARKGEGGPMVYRPKGALRSNQEATAGLWLHEALKHASQPMAQLFNKAMQREEFATAGAYLQLVGQERKALGVHTEVTYGLHGGEDDPHEGFPFCAETWETALDSLDDASPEDRQFASELYSLAAWVFSQTWTELVDKAKKLQLEEDSRTGISLVLYTQCGTPESPVPSQIRRTMRLWAKAVDLRKRRNADGGHPFLLSSLNPLQLVKERIEDFGDELLCLPERLQEYIHLGSHAWLELKEMVDTHPGCGPEPSKPAVSKDRLKAIRESLSGHQLEFKEGEREEEEKENETENGGKDEKEARKERRPKGRNTKTIKKTESTLEDELLSLSLPNLVGGLADLDQAEMDEVGIDNNASTL